MQQREYILAAVAAGLLGLYGLHSARTGIVAWYDARESQLTALDRKAKELQLSIRKGEQARKRLAAVEAQSLPSDLEQAQALYQQWLAERVEQVRFTAPMVEPGRAAPVTISRAGKREVVYQVLPYTLRARGTLDQLTRFLFDFYSAPHLHQLRRMSVKPLEKGGLDLNLGIEAVLVPTATRVDSLSTEPVKRLDLATWDEYRKTIDGRNVFTAYAPPPPPRPDPPPVARRPDPPAPPAPPAFDAAKHTVVTAVLEVSGAYQVWLLNRTSGETMKLNQGEKFKVGAFQGTVGDFSVDGVWLESNGKKTLYTVGKPLRESGPSPERFPQARTDR